MTTTPNGAAGRGDLALLDWRRRVHSLYAEVRATASPIGAHESWRRGRDELFATHPQSPLRPEIRVGFVGLPIAPYDPAWRFEVDVETDVAPAHLDVASATDGVVPLDRVGRLALSGVGSLDVWALRSYGGGLFVPVRDATAGRTSYGGGRYLLDTVKGADLGGDVDLLSGRGTLVVDLNFAYHPSCAYDPGWVCPLAPSGNVLDVEVVAGELLPPDGWY